MVYRKKQLAIESICLLKQQHQQGSHFNMDSCFRFFHVILAFRNPEFSNLVFPMLYDICKQDGAKNSSPSVLISPSAGIGKLPTLLF
jgi:hypothetical protein